MSMTADDVIRILKLQPHPVEGGFFREIYRSRTTLPAGVLPQYAGPRSLATTIYYLLKPGHVSEMHALPGDEIFHFYLGSPVQMLQLWPHGKSHVVTLGNDLTAGQVPQLVVPAGVWQGTRLLADDGFALLGATMAPGFDYTDYKGAGRAVLTEDWPAQAELIAKLTPKG
ncbi:cupin domain-containing protein [Limnoglobus roseus]|uniref:Cupin domain-containing protein n=1 Tax=Limnoglobus roseus TaxID=2598579 RepID=A0A5C1AAI6_9BACT|nr:cupin domain-containing protein [Limnoglobus roseus]QEL15740.1 cupin domain-containing protein [Limnoglobus roseus]